MKIYTGMQKEDNKFVSGVTVHTEKGELVKSTRVFNAPSTNKYDNQLFLLEWAVKKIKTWSQNKVIDDNETITLFIPSKTVYTWLEREVAPEPYTVRFSDILLDLAFISNPVEIIFSKSAISRVSFKESHEEKLEKVTDLFAVTQ